MVAINIKTGIALYRKNDYFKGRQKLLNIVTLLYQYLGILVVYEQAKQWNEQLRIEMAYK